MRVHRWLVVAALVVFAGCLGTTDPGAEAGTGNETGAVEGLSTETLTIAEDCGTCFEPTVAVHEDTAYVASGSRDEILVTDLATGETDTVPEPPLPETANPDATTGDETVRVTDEGRLYFTALLCDLACGSEGIQVAASDDGGQTWTINTAVNPVNYPTEPTSGVDRQWLGLGPGERVHLVYSQYAPRTGVWAALSEDGGQSWQQFANAHPRPSAGSPGAPVVDGDTVILPGRSTTHVDVSTDAGQSWEVLDVPGPDVDRWMVGEQRHGNVHLAWTTDGGEVRYTRSTDGLQQWAEPASWTPEDANATAPPTLEVREDSLKIAWYDDHGDSLHVHVARAPLGEALEGPARVSTLEPAFEPVETSQGRACAPPTDFAHADGTTRGRAVVVYSSCENMHLGVVGPG
ncbi:hypothetical protein BRD56_00045 [Thermoplasmatales archaeon SW_10_69_26]|nr:MAG: hypothetical protein BRD56_00045 [Thermoplasmatales archaeon SW_10_69_26]